MGRRPAQEVAGAADVEDVVVVALVDHPRFHELVLAQGFALKPGARLGDRLRDAKGGPVLPVQRLSDDVLDLAVAQGFRLADENGNLLRQRGASIDRTIHYFGQVLHMDEGLPGAEHAGIEMRRQSMLVDAGDLFGDEGRARQVVVDAGDAQKHERNVPVTLPQDGLRPHLGLGIGPGGLDRRVLVDQLVVPIGRPVDQHAAGVDELLHLEALQRVDQAAGPPDVDRVVERVGLAGDVVVGREVHHRLNSGPVARPDFVQSACDPFIRPEVEIDRLGRGKRLGRTGSVEGHHLVLGSEAPDEGPPDEAGCARDQNDAVVGHAHLPSPSKLRPSGAVPSIAAARAVARVASGLRTRLAADDYTGPVLRALTRDRSGV